MLTCLRRNEWLETESIQMELRKLVFNNNTFIAVELLNYLGVSLISGDRIYWCQDKNENAFFYSVPKLLSSKTSNFYIVVSRTYDL